MDTILLLLYALVLKPPSTTAKSEISFSCKINPNNNHLQLIVAGKTVSLSQFISSPNYVFNKWTTMCTGYTVEELVVVSDYVLIIDKDLNSMGTLRNLSFISPLWIIEGRRKIILKGRNGDTLPPGRDGKVLGESGTDGIQGNPGQNGGSFFGNYVKIKNQGLLYINVNGGNGGNGQDGGNGADGAKGKTFSEEEFVTSPKSVAFCKMADDPTIPFPLTSGKIYCGKFINNTQIYDTSYRFVPGWPGLKGGNGGNGGIGGKGGIAGTIVFYNFVKHLSPLIETVTQNGVNGSPGLVGRDGNGGKYGDTINCKVKVVFRFPICSFVESTFHNQMSNNTLTINLNDNEHIPIRVRRSTTTTAFNYTYTLKNDMESTNKTEMALNTKRTDLASLNGSLYNISCEKHGNRLVVYGKYVKFSDFISDLNFHNNNWGSCTGRTVKELMVSAIDCIEIDKNINASGLELWISLIAPIWNISSLSVDFDLTGKNGEDITGLPPHPVIPGYTGLHGANGNPGQDGGHFVGIYLHHSEFGYIRLKNTGGNGGNGQRGGYGASGNDAIWGPVSSYYFLSNQLRTTVYDGFCEKLWDNELQYNVDGSQIQDNKIYCGTFINDNVIDARYGLEEDDLTKAGKIPLDSRSIGTFMLYESGYFGGNGGIGGDGGVNGAKGFVNVYSLQDSSGQYIVASIGLDAKCGEPGRGGDPGIGGRYVYTVNWNATVEYDTIVTDKPIWLRPTNKRKESGYPGYSGQYPQLKTLSPEKMDRSNTLLQEHLQLFKSTFSQQQEELKPFLDAILSSKELIPIVGYESLAGDIISLEDMYFITDDESKNEHYAREYYKLLIRIEMYADYYKLGENWYGTGEDKFMFSLMYAVVLSKLNAVRNKTEFERVIGTDGNFFTYSWKLMELLNEGNKKILINELLNRSSEDVDVKIKTIKRVVEQTVPLCLDTIRFSVDQSSVTLASEIKQILNDNLDFTLDLYNMKQNLESHLNLSILYSYTKFISNVLNLAITNLQPDGGMYDNVIPFSEISFLNVGELPNLLFSTNFEESTDTLYLAERLYTVERALLIVEEQFDESYFFFSSYEIIPNIISKMQMVWENIGNASASNKSETVLAYAMELDLWWKRLEVEIEETTEPNNSAVGHMITVLTVAKAGVHVYDAFYEYREYQSDPMTAAITEVAVNLKHIERKRDDMYKIFFPDANLELNETDSKIHKNIFSNISLPELIRKLGDAQRHIYSFVENSTFDKEILDCVDELADAIEFILSLLGNVETYQKRKQLGDLIANIDIFDETLIENTENTMIEQLKFSLQFNLYLEQYKSSIESFVKWTFPSAHIYLDGLNMTDFTRFSEILNYTQLHMYFSNQTSTLETLMAMYQSDVLKKLILSSTTPGTIDFQSLRVWSTSKNQDQIRKLLEGEAVDFIAALPGLHNKISSIKYITITIVIYPLETQNQISLAPVFNNFKMNLTHNGISTLYFAGKKYYFNERPVTYNLKFSGNVAETLSSQATLLTQRKYGSYLLSPYTTWTLQFLEKDLPSPVNLTSLKNYQMQFRIALVGNVTYISEKASTFDSKVFNVDKYYREFEAL